MFCKHCCNDCWVGITREGISTHSRCRDIIVLCPKCLWILNALIEIYVKTHSEHLFNSFSPYWEHSCLKEKKTLINIKVLGLKAAFWYLLCFVLGSEGQLNRFLYFIGLYVSHHLSVCTYLSQMTKRSFFWLWGAFH